MKSMLCRYLAALLLVLTLLAAFGAAQATTTATDITTPSDITTGTDIPPKPPVTGEDLRLSGPASVRGGERVTLTATLDGKAISASLLDWAVYPYNTNLCTISRGVLSTKKVTYPQKVQVTAVLKSNPTVYADLLITVCPGVSKLTISAPAKTIDLSVSNVMQLSAVVAPDGASTGVKWSSSSTSRATVDENGLVTAKKTGSVTITARATDGSGKSASVTLQIVYGVTGLSITGPSSVAEGKSITLKAVVLPENATNDDVTWSVDCDKSVATISSSGKLTAKSVDQIMTVTVTATSRQNPAIRATHTVTIRPVVSGLTIRAPTTVIDLDSANPTLQLSAVCTPADASQQVTWSSSSSSRATVDANGLVTAKNTGTATITARAADGSGRSASITIRIVRAVKSLTITGPGSVAAGKSVTLTASLTPENASNSEVTWSVDCDKSIATISSSGKLTARSGLTNLVTVTVKCVSRENPAIYDTHQVTIRPVTAKITITAPRTTIDLTTEPTLQLTALCTPADASQEVVWSSSSTSRATVDANGLVTALKTGTVTITARATDGSGRSASITLKIVRSVKSIVISGPAEMASGYSVTLKATVLPEGASNDDVTWSVDCDKSVATISSSGKLTAKKGIAAPVTITVTCTSDENAAITATHQVTILPAVEKITITAPQTVIDLDSESPTLQLSAACAPEGASQQVTWSSSSSRATVDANGLVTAHRVGTVTITARAADGTGKTASITIQIVNAAKGLTITGATELAGGSSTKLTAVITPDHATNKSVVWSVDCDSSVATITTSGRLYARKVSEPVTVTVSCVSKENAAIRDTHTVTIRPPVGRISIAAPRLWIDVTSATPTLKLTAICTPDTAGQGVTWSTSRSGVATVDANGLVTGHKTGTATITARANDGSGRYTSVTVRVIKPITSITIAGDNTVTAGRTLRLRYAVAPSDATSKKLTWTISCDSSVATVTGGVVSAKNVTEPTVVIVTAASADNPSVKAQFVVLIMPK